jgi:hypothetical protein
MSRVDVGQTVGLPNVQLGRLGVIAIARAVRGPHVAETGLAAIALHRDEITQGRIHAATASRHVHFERQLLVEQVCGT